MSSVPFWIPIYTEQGFSPEIQKLSRPLEKKFERLTKEWWSDVENLKKIDVSNYPSLQREKDNLLHRADKIKSKILSIPGYKPNVTLEGAPVVLIGGALVAVIAGIMALMYKWRIDFYKFNEVFSEFREIKKVVGEKEASIIMARLKGEAYDRQQAYKNITIGLGIIGGMYLISKVVK